MPKALSFGLSPIRIKDELIDASLADLTDPTRICAKVTATEGKSSLGDQVQAIIDVLLDEVATISQLVGLMHQRRIKKTGHQEFHKNHRYDHGPLRDAMAETLQPFSGQMNISPTQAAWFIEATLLSATMPHIPDPPFDSPAEITRVLLAGIQSN